MRKLFQARIKRSSMSQRKEDAISVTSVEIQVWHSFQHLSNWLFRSGLAQKTRIYMNPQGKVENTNQHKIYFLSLYGIGIEQSQTAAILLHSIFLLYTIILGYIYLSFEKVRFLQRKDMYQKPMKGVIGTHFKFKELYPWPNHSSNISIKKVIGNDMERLKVESKWANLHIFCHFCS